MVFFVILLVLGLKVCNLSALLTASLEPCCAHAATLVCADELGMCSAVLVSLLPACLPAQHNRRQLGSYWKLAAIEVHKLRVLSRTKKHDSKTIIARGGSYLASLNRQRQAAC